MNLAWAGAPRRQRPRTARAWIAAALGVIAWALPGAAQPVDLPIVERPFEHEAALGYAPWYIPNVPAFDRDNRPYLRSRATDPHVTGYIQTIRNGRWVRRDFTGAIRAAYPTFAKIRYGGGTFGSCITIDDAQNLYTLVRIRLQDDTDRDLLIYSTDLGDTFKVVELPNNEPPGSKPEGFANIEFRASPQPMTRPPLIATLRKRADHPLGQWTAHYNMYLIQPRFENGALTLSEPALVTDHGLYMSRHAGNPSFAVSGGDRTFFTWAETTENNYVPGAPTFIATFDPTTLKITDRQFCAFAYPPNDGHNSPGIVMDPSGFLHVITGGHGENFKYARSKAPRSTAEGMTDPVPMVTKGWSEFGVDRGRQSYLSFVCTADSALHAVFRQWYKGTEPWFTDSYFGSLSYQTKPAAADAWPETSRLMVVPPLDGYSIYYQTMTIDRNDRIYLSYGYRNEKKEYGTGEAENHYLALLMSPDQGRTWRLVTTEDFASGISEHASEDAKLAPGKVTGSVVDPEGKPVGGAKVSAMGVTTRTAPDGTFTFSPVFTDEFDITASAESASPGVAAVNLAGKSAAEVLIRLQHEQRPSGAATTSAP